MAMQVGPGRYAVKITDHKLTEAKKGTLQLAFSIEVLGGIDPADPEHLTDEGAGLQRTIFRPITEKTAEWLWRDLTRLNFEGDSFDLLDREAAGDKFVSLEGREVAARCTPNEWDGKVNERWDFDMGGGGPNLQAADRSKVREASAMFSRKRVMGAKAKAATATAEAPKGDVLF